MLNIAIQKTTHPAPKPAPGANLGFGHIFTDHMFIMNYEEGKGWFDPRIVPFQRLSLSPAAMVFHYGQAMFEGMKAYPGKDGSAYIFRPDMNAKRANRSNDRLCIPHIPEEDLHVQMDATDALGAAYCHFLQMGRPQATHTFKSWKDFVNKNAERIKK